MVEYNNGQSQKKFALKFAALKTRKKLLVRWKWLLRVKCVKRKIVCAHAQPYAKKILQVISHVARGHPEYRHPFMQTREIKRVGFIVVTTDRGLCGGLNS